MNLTVYSNLPSKSTVPELSASISSTISSNSSSGTAPSNSLKMSLNAATVKYPLAGMNKFINYKKINFFRSEVKA